MLHIFRAFLHDKSMITHFKRYTDLNNMVSCILTSILLLRSIITPIYGSTTNSLVLRLHAQRYPSQDQRHAYPCI